MNSVLLRACIGKLGTYDMLANPFEYEQFDHISKYNDYESQWDQDLFFDDDDDYGEGYSDWDQSETDMGEDIDVEGPCKADLVSHPHCSESGGNKAVCLWMDNVDSVRWANHHVGFYKPVEPECKSSLIEFLTNASNHPFKYFHDLKTDCASDLSSLCSNTTKEATALGCLRSNFDSISDSNCMDEIVHLNSWTSLNETWWSPSMWQDCLVERRGPICQNRTSTGISDFRDCLDDHRSELSEKCHRALFQSDMQAAPNPFLLRRDVSSKCIEESKNFCSDVSFQDENQVFCLFRASKRQPTYFHPDCGEAIISVITLIESDYRMNVPMRKFCRRTIDEFCPKEKIENDLSGVENDAVITCLKRVYLFKEHHSRKHDHADETEACMGVMRQSVLISSLDWEADSDLHSNCLHDYHRLQHRIETLDPTLRDADACENESPHQCLQSHIHDLEDPECQRAVMLHSQLSALDQDFKPQLLTACALALDHLDCPSDKSVECLYEKIDTIHDQHCREAIRHDFELSDRDYRLSYALSMVCEADRVSLCNSIAPAGVLECMIEKLEAIQSPECESDVSRLAFVAQSEGEELASKSVCASDVLRLNCTGQLHGTVHACLISNIETLSAFCSAEVLNLHRSVGSMQSLEKALNSACSHELIADCKHLVLPSSEIRLTEKAECLEHPSLTPRSAECESQLHTVQTLLSSDYRTNPGLVKDCKTDLKLLCNEETSSSFSSKSIECLISNRMQIRNTNCKRHIVSTIYRMSEDVQFVPNMRKVCGDDIKKYCSAVAPKGGELHACLRDNLEYLSHDCQSQEFTVEQIESISATTRTACDFELNKQMCQRSAEMLGGELHCLWRNVDEVSLGCARATKKEMKGKVGNIWLDPVVYTRCRTVVNAFISDGLCPQWLQQLPVPLNGLIPLPSNYTQSVSGEHVQCLGRNRAKIADRQCLNPVESLLRMEANDPLLFRFGLRTACKRDLSAGGVCGESDPFETLGQWRCLQDGLVNLTSACIDSVKRVWRMSMIDVSFNPDISSNCVSEISKYCANVTKGGTRTVACLAQAYNQTESTIVFSEECAEAVKRLPSADVLDLTNPWSIAKKQAEAILSEKLPEIENARLLQTTTFNMGIAISGPLAVVSLGSLFFLVAAGLYRLYRYKMNKGYMVIVEKD